MDDFWGEWAWQQWAEEIGRVLPPKDYPIVDIGPDHPFYRTMFVVTEMPQIPSINLVDAHGRRDLRARRRERRGAHCAASAIEHGRLMVLMTHNTDISDAWEREGEDPRYFYQFSPDGYAVGINMVIYALTH